MYANRIYTGNPFLFCLSGDPNSNNGLISVVLKFTCTLGITLEFFHLGFQKYFKAQATPVWTKLYSLKFIRWSPSPPCDCIWRQSFEDINKVKWGHKRGALIWQEDVLIRSCRLIRELSHHIYTEEPCEETVTRHLILKLLDSKSMRK